MSDKAARMVDHIKLFLMQCENEGIHTGLTVLNEESLLKNLTEAFDNLPPEEAMFLDISFHQVPRSALLGVVEETPPLKSA